MAVSTSTAERIRRGHRAIDSALDELASLAGRVASGDRSLWLAVERALHDLRTHLMQHHALESRALLPALTSGNGWGIILAQHVAGVHRNHMALIDEALDLAAPGATERATRVRVLAQILREDMEREEEWLDQLAPTAR